MSREATPENRYVYQVINLVFLVLLAGVLLYSLIFSDQKDRYPLPSVYNKIMLKQSPTTGLSHSFSAMIRGNIKRAYQWNRYGPGIFLFLLAEIFMRIIAFFLVHRHIFPFRTIVLTDIILTVVFFGLSYGKLLFFWEYM